jgi:hypothetical protein
MSPKTKRSAYTALPEIEVYDPGLKTTFWIRLLIDSKTLLTMMGPLALQSRFNHNKQIYGPIKVEVRAEGNNES